MKKNFLIIFGIILVVSITLTVGFLFLFKNISPKAVNLHILKASDEEITTLLKTNEDAKNYIEKNKDFKIEERTVLTKESITEGQNGQNFKEVYQGLELEDNRYLKISLMNVTGDKGLVSVIDFKDGKVLKAYGLILLKSSAK